MRSFTIILLLLVFFSCCFGQELEVILPIGHTDQIKKTTFSDDGRFMATYSNDESIIVWDLSHLVPMCKINASDYVKDLYFYDDNTLYYDAGYGSDNVFLYDFYQRKIIFNGNLEISKTSNLEIHPQLWIYNDISKELVKVSKIEKRITEVESEEFLNISWPLKKQETEIKLSKSVKKVLYADISDDSKKMIIGGLDREYIIDLMDNKVIKCDTIFFEENIYPKNSVCKISSNNQYYAVETFLNKMNNIEIVEVSTNKRIGWQIRSEITFLGLDVIQFSQDNQSLVAYNSLYPKSTEIFDLKKDSLITLTAESFSCSFSKKQNKIAFTKYRKQGKFIYIYDLGSKSIVDSIAVKERIKSNSNGDFFIAGGSGGDFEIYSYSNTTKIKSFSNKLDYNDGLWSLNNTYPEIILQKDDGFHWNLNDSFMPFPQKMDYYPAIGLHKLNLNTSSIIEYERNKDDGKISLNFYNTKTKTTDKYETNIFTASKDSLRTFITESGNLYGLIDKNDKKTHLFYLDSLNNVIKYKENKTNKFYSYSTRASKYGRYLLNDNNILDLMTDKIINLNKGSNKKLKIGNLLFTDKEDEVIGTLRNENWGDNPVMWHGIWKIPSGKLIRKYQVNAEDFIFDISKNNQYVLIKNDDENRLKLVNYYGKSILDISESSTIHIEDFKITTDNKYLLYTSKSTTKLWSIEKKKLLASLAFFDGGDWVIYTPENYYFGTPGATSKIFFARGKEVYAFDDFDLQYNRPDKVLETIDPNLPAIKVYRDAYLKRQEKYPTVSKREVDELPTIDFTNRNALSLTTQNKETSIELFAKSHQTNLKTIHIWVNGIPIYGTEGLDISANKNKELQKELTLKLSRGENIIEIACTDDIGATSLRKSVNISSTIPEQKPDIYFVGVGVSRYLDSTNNLKFATKDIDDLKVLFDTIMIQNASKYNKINFSILKDSTATKQNILNIRNTLKNTKEEDIVIMAFNGHGLLSKELDFYFATHDVDFQSPQNNGFKYGDIEVIVDGIPARNRLILIDACHSGDVEKNGIKYLPIQNTIAAIGSRGIELQTEDKQSRASTYDLMLSVFTNLNVNSGNNVFVASGGQEVAMEGGGINNGVFTYSIIETLKKDYKVDIAKLKTRVEEEVSKLTNGRQKPNFRRINYKNNFMVPYLIR